MNTFSLDIKRPEIRERFLESGRELMTEYGLTEHEIDMVERRDWRALVAHGGHLQAITAIANAVGQSHLHIGAAMCGTDWASFQESLPRMIDLLPGDID